MSTENVWRVHAEEEYTRMIAPLEFLAMTLEEYRALAAELHRPITDYRIGERS